MFLLFFFGFFFFGGGGGGGGGGGVSCAISEFPQTFDNWIQGLFKDFKGQQQQQFSRIYFKSQPRLPALLAICSSQRILYCHMI